MRVKVFVECDICTDDIEIVNDYKALQLPLKSEIRSEAKRLGWHIGRRCICPDCLERYADCGNCFRCKHWQNKTMETPFCDLDGELALGLDYCDSYEMLEDERGSAGD